MASDFFTIQDKMRHLRSALDRLEPEVERHLHAALDISWIYHDAALEGDMLDADEIVAAIEGKPPVAGSTEQISRRIRTFKNALEATRREVRQPSGDSMMQLLKRMHSLLSPEPASRGGRYRRGNTGHKAYFHEVAKASRVSYLLRKLFAWLESEEARRLHPIRVAGEAHYRLLLVSPFEDCSGPVARLFTSYLLFSHGLLPAIVHARDRQRYYEAFVPPTSDELTDLLAASLENGIESCLRLLEQRRTGVIAVGAA